MHFVNRDSLGLANDFLSLGFLPEGVDIQSVSDALQTSLGDGTRLSQDFQVQMLPFSILHGYLSFRVAPLIHFSKITSIPLWYIHFLCQIVVNKVKVNLFFLLSFCVVFS